MLIQCVLARKNSRELKKLCQALSGVTRFSFDWLSQIKIRKARNVREVSSMFGIFSSWMLHDLSYLLRRCTNCGSLHIAIIWICARHKDVHGRNCFPQPKPYHFQHIESDLNLSSKLRNSRKCAKGVAALFSSSRGCQMWNVEPIKLVRCDVSTSFHF